MRRSAGPVLIREAAEKDRAALTRLAQLDCGSVPKEPVLLALCQGELRAALSLRNGAVIADPFRSTADLVRLLELRAAQLSELRRLNRRRVTRFRRLLRLPPLRRSRAAESLSAADRFHPAPAARPKEAHAWRAG